MELKINFKLALIFETIFNPIHPGWLAMMSVCFLYNAWVIPFRYIFSEYQTEDNYHVWFIIDYCIVDIFYLVDILVFKYRIMYMENGFWVKVCLLPSKCCVNNSAIFLRTRGNWQIIILPTEASNMTFSLSFLWTFSISGLVKNTRLSDYQDF